MGVSAVFLVGVDVAAVRPVFPETFFFFQE